jgi:hypothetical protein
LKIWGWVFLGVAIAGAFSTAMFANELNAQKKYNEVLVVQNVQFTKDMREAKAVSYRMGILACGNEDVSYLNSLAADYQGTVLGKLFKQMAMNWSYDDDTLNQMVESYMDEGTN